MKKNGINFAKIVEIFRKAFHIGIRARNTSSKVLICFGFLVVFLPTISSLLLEKFTNTMHMMATNKELDWGHAISLFTMICVIQIVLKIYESLQEYHVVYDTECVRAYIKEFVIKTKCKVQYKYIMNYDDFSEKITFIDTYAGERVANSIQNIILWLQDMIQFGLIIIVLNRVNLWIVIVLIATSIPSVILSYKQNDADYSYKVKWMKEGAFLINYFFELCSLRSMHEVRYFGLFHHIKNLWKKTFGEYVKKKTQITRKHIRYNVIADILRNGIYLVILLILAASIYRNPSIGIGVFMLVFTLSKQMQKVTIRLLTGAAQFLNDITYMKNFFDLEELEDDCGNQSGERYNNAEISFQDVSFTYPNTERRVLNHLNLIIPPGQKIAIVGVNGSGKTTLVSLLCGMYTDMEGEVTINGETVSEHLDKARNSMSVIFQDFGRYEGSIRDNIVMADSERSQEEDAVLDQLTQRSGIYEKIQELPHRYDELIGSFSKNRNCLSGGEWQKIGIARALYRNDSSIMILDEPTAALDSIAEAQLYRNFVELTADRTTILISHRLGITSMVDRVIVMDEGKVVEDGDHDALMKLNGIYASMYRAQSKWYQ